MKMIVKKKLGMVCGLSVLLFVPLVVKTSSPAHGYWEPFSPYPWARDSGEPLHVLMTNNESYDYMYVTESYVHHLYDREYRLGIGAEIEILVVNHANSNYPLSPVGMAGWFEKLSENPTDLPLVTRGNAMGTTWTDRVLHPGRNWTAAYRKLEPEFDVSVTEGIRIAMPRINDSNVPGDQPANTSVWATSIITVTKEGEPPDSGFLDWAGAPVWLASTLVSAVVVRTVVRRRYKMT